MLSQEKVLYARAVKALRLHKRKLMCYDGINMFSSVLQSSVLH